MPLKDIRSTVTNSFEQLLYSRLLLCKRIGAQLAAEGSSSCAIDPVAADSGVELMPDSTAVPGNAAEYFYGHLLELCEKIFDNVIDQATFEDTVRYMFGMKAYNVFTLDKVIGALIKQVISSWSPPLSGWLTLEMQVQFVLLDSKNKELVHLLQRERENPSSSTQDQINYRRKAESVVGADEHLYRINYVGLSCICFSFFLHLLSPQLPDSRTFTIQLLGKDDVREDDSPAMIDRWNRYMESYQKVYHRKRTITV